jgi:NADP-dependent aldehyde dehydrogenase
LERISGVRVAGKAAVDDKSRAGTVVLATDAKTFLQHQQLQEENFGPSTIIVSGESAAELEQIARAMAGQLTATIHGTEEDLERYCNLISILQQKVGRLIFNQFPTGVEVCASMQHGGPYPATTDSRTTSVGTAAIKRFARPVAFQNFPDAMLPPELRNQNVRKIWRLVDNQFTKDDV